jgi:hypothetical protein
MLGYCKELKIIHFTCRLVSQKTFMNYGLVFLESFTVLQKEHRVYNELFLMKYNPLFF